MSEQYHWWSEELDPDQIIRVDWHNQNDLWWNETCAMVMEAFGLPGHRFYYSPHTDYMIFKFKTKSDSLMCRLLLSDRI